MDNYLIIIGGTTNNREPQEVNYYCTKKEYDKITDLFESVRKILKYINSSRFIDIYNVIKKTLITQNDEYYYNLDAIEEDYNWLHQYSEIDLNNFMEFFEFYAPNDCDFDSRCVTLDYFDTYHAELINCEDLDI